MKKILIFVMLIFALISCGKQTNIDDNDTIIINNTKPIQFEKTEVIIDDEEEIFPGLQEDLVDFNETYKQALFNTWKGNEIAIEQTKKTMQKWQNIAVKYEYKEAEGFSNTPDLYSKILEINTYTIKANELVSENKLSEAHEELEMVRKLIAQLRQENNIKNISDDMLIVHDIMEEIVEDGVNKNMQHYESIKKWIQELYIYNTENDEYKNMLWNYESFILQLEKMSWNEYTTKLEELKPIFVKMYLKFG